MYVRELVQQWAVAVGREKPWFDREYFANACVVACGRAADYERVMSDIRDRWQEKVRPRANSAAALLLDVLPSTLVVSVESVARLTGRSREAARLTIATLVDTGIFEAVRKEPEERDLRGARGPRRVHSVRAGAYHPWWR